jgi:hypothetical protein
MRRPPMSARPLRARLRGKGPRVAAPLCPANAWNRAPAPRHGLPRQTWLRCVRAIGMKDRQNLRCSFLRACGFALLNPSSHKSYYAQSRPQAVSRWRGNPRHWGPRRLTDRRPGSLSITASCGQRGCSLSRSLLADGCPDPAPPPSTQRARQLAGILHAICPHSAPCSVTRGRGIWRGENRACTPGCLASKLNRFP